MVESPHPRTNTKEPNINTHWPGGSNYENSAPMVVKDADDDDNDGDVDEQQQRVGVIGAIGDGEGATIDVSILPRLRH